MDEVLLLMNIKCIIDAESNSAQTNVKRAIINCLILYSQRWVYFHCGIAGTR